MGAKLISSGLRAAPERAGCYTSGCSQAQGAPAFSVGQGLFWLSGCGCLVGPGRTIARADGILRILPRRGAQIEDEQESRPWKFNLGGNKECTKNGVYAMVLVAVYPEAASRPEKRQNAFLPSVIPFLAAAPLPGSPRGRWEGGVRGVPSSGPKPLKRLDSEKEMK